VSRIGKKPIPIPDKVNVQVQGTTVTVKGPKGELVRKFHPETIIEIKDKEIIVTRKNNTGFQRSLHGTARAIIANMVNGVVSGFEKKMEIVGVGYKVELKDNIIRFSLGFSHPILFIPPQGVEINLTSPTVFSVKGIDKQVVGQVATKIRSFKEPEPYKGKGIKYSDEKIKRKAGKAAAKK
jgi:large subunit ribosomal protein L6